MKKMKIWAQATPAQRIERWQNALRVLEELTPHERIKHWSMGWWGTKTDCGTVACAAGHCGLDPWFRRRGFQMNFEPRYWVGTSGRVQDWRVQMSSAADFFGYRGAERIFYNGRSRSVAQVITEVKDYLHELTTAQGKDPVAEEVPHDAG